MEPRSAVDLESMLAPLANHVRRRLRYLEAVGELRPGDLMPEDVVDAAYLAAGEHMLHRPSGAAGYRWLRSLAEGVIADELRRVRRDPTAADDAPPRSLQDFLPDGDTPEPEAATEDLELQRAIARVLGELPAALRDPLLLLVVDGYEIWEVAALEELSREEVTRRTAQAGELLCRRLADEYGDREPLPLARLYRLVERVVPSSDDAARVRQHLARRPG